MTDPRAASRTPDGLIGNANFVLLWCAYGVSAVGDHLSEMAILKTQDALNVNVDITPLNARMTFMFFVPFLLLAPFTGLLADRLPRRGLMVVSDCARCAVVFFLAWLIAHTESWGDWGPFVPLAAVGAFAAVFSPARSSLLPTIVRPAQLVRANGLISGLGIIATMVAAKLSGYLADHYDPVVSFRADAATFVLSAVFLVMMRPPAQPPPRGTHRPLGDLVAGFCYARRHRHVLELLVVASLVWFCGPLVNSVIPAIVRDVYGGTYETISNYRAFLGLGFVIGAIVVSVLGSALKEQVAITWGFFGIAAGIGAFGASIYLPLARDTLAWIGAVGVVMAGLFAVAVIASFNSLLQKTVANHYRGRIFGVKDLCTTASLLLATGLLAMPGWTDLDRAVGSILLVVAIVMAVAGFVTMRVRLARGPHGAGVNVLANLNDFICRFWYRLERVGRSTVPRTGQAIIASNHINSADPMLLSASVPYRLISFLVAREYAEWPIVRYLVRLLECIPVRRGTRETSATKEAMRRLGEGKAVGIFIEGGFVRPGEPGRPKDGVALLALRTGAPVIPAYISGMNYYNSVVLGLLARHRARVRFGPPVDLSEFTGVGHDRAAVRAATAKVFAAVQALAPPEGPYLRGPARRDLDKMFTESN